MDICSICKASVDTENAAILSMGGFGTPRYMCPECESDFEEMTLSRDAEAINLAISRIGKKISESRNDDKVTLRTIEELMKSSAERKEKIKEGTYDFSDEEAAAESTEDDEVPEELRESEEDIENERIRSEKYKKLDAVTNWILMAVFVGAVGYMIYRILITWFF